MKVLIVIDMQNDFISGSLANPAAQAICSKIAAYAKNFDGLVIFTQDTHYDSYMSSQEGRFLPVVHTIEGTPGHALAPEIYDAFLERQTKFNSDLTQLVQKPSFGYRYWKEEIDLNPNYDVMKDVIESIEICGTCTDICVISNALMLKALYPEVPLTVHMDMCAAVDEEGQKAAEVIFNRCQCIVHKEESEAPTNTEEGEAHVHPTVQE